MNRLIYLLFYTLTYSINLFAQEANSFSKIEGLTSNVVYCVKQDRKGFIWIGTDLGVSRYDGVNLKHFTKEDGLSDNEVFQIHEDSQGKLWFLTYNGQPTIYYNNQLYSSKNSNLLKQIGSKKNAVAFLETIDQSIWYLNLDTAYCFKNERLVRKIALSQINANASIFFLIQEINQQTLLFCSNGWYNTTTNNFVYYPQKMYFSNNNTKSVLKEHTVFISTERTIVELNVQANSVNTYKVPNGELILNLINSINEIIWVCTSNHIYEFNTKTKKFTITEHPVIVWFSFILKDSRSHTWVTSLTGGLYFKENTFNNALHWVRYTTKHQLTNCLDLEWVNNDLYVGFEDGELAKWQSGSLKTVYRASQSEAFKKIRQITAVKDGLWLSVDGLLSFYNTTTGESTEYSGAVKAMAILPNGNQYFALSNRVVKSNFQLGNGLKKTNMYMLPIVYNGNIRSLLSIGNDTLIMGGYEGLRCLIKDRFVDILSRDHPYSNIPISCIFQTKQKHILIGSKEKGIGILTKDSCYTITSQEGLNSNSINQITEDSNGKIWVATAKGINCIRYAINNYRKLEIELVDYNKFTGMPYEAVNHVAFRSDTLWFTTNKGLYFFLEKLVPSNPPTIYIASVLVNQKPIQLKDSISLNFNAKSIRFNFGAIDFSNQRNIIYRYKLKGINDNWIETKEPFAEYAYIPPGDYILYVGSASGAFSKQQIRSIHFKIFPPYWKTTWFIIISIVLVGILTFGIVRYWFQNIQKKQALLNKTLRLAKQKAEFEKEVIELQQQALRLQMNPHFIFNAIYAIEGYYAVGNIQEGKKYVAGFARLLRLILDTANSKSISVENEIKLLTNYLQLLKMRRNNPFEFNINLYGIEDTSFIQIPSMVIQPFVENAAIHGVAALESGGKIDISFELHQYYLICVIEDNGIGRKAAKKLNMQQTHVSSGIQITEKRLHLFAKNMQMNEIADVKIEDKLNNDGLAIGTKVILQIPILK